MKNNDEEIEEKPKKETYRAKFIMLAILSLAQTVLLIFVLENGIVYHFSMLENILVCSIIAIFYIILLAKKQIQAIINKMFNW